MKYAIETKLQDLFIADSSLDEVKVFFIGEPYIIRNTDYPAVIIFIQDQVTTTPQTGVWIYNYTGYLAVETLIPDRYEPKDRAATIDSFLTVRTILDAMTDLLQLEANLALDNLTSDGETVRVLTLEANTKTYGFAERTNNILNRGEVPFVVETQKKRA